MTVFCTHRPILVLTRTSRVPMGITATGRSTSVARTYTCCPLSQPTVGTFVALPLATPTSELALHTGSYSSTRHAQANVSQTHSPKPYQYGAPSSTAPYACVASTTPFLPVRTGCTHQARGLRTMTGICAPRRVQSARTSTRRSQRGSMGGPLASRYVTRWQLR